MQQSKSKSPFKFVCLIIRTANTIQLIFDIKPIPDEFVVF